MLTWFTFGMAEYCFQTLLIVALAIGMKKIQKKFLISFVTAFLYGTILDAVMKIIGLIPGEGWGLRIVFFGIGMFLCAGGVSLLFHTYIAPEAYELVVKEISGKFHKNISVVKTIYDCCSCTIAIFLSFLFFGFGHFEGVKLGTVLCALVNGSIIGAGGKYLEKHFEFVDNLKIRKFLS